METKTIEERAKICATNCIDWCYNTRNTDPNGVTHEIEKALREQQEIDIQRAVEWLKLNVSEYLLVNFYGEKYIETDYLVKEFEQSMKGDNQ